MHGYNGLYHLILVNQMGFMVGWFMGSVYGFWNGNPTKVRLVQKRYWRIPHHHIHVISLIYTARGFMSPRFCAMVTDILSLAMPRYYRKRYEQAKFARLAAALDCSSRAALVRGWSWYGHGMFIQEELRGMYIHISYTHIHTCVCNNIYFTCKHVASHVNILCACTSLSIKALGHSFAVCCCVWQGVEWPDCRGDFLHRMTWSRAKSQTPYATDTLFFCSQFVWDVGIGSRTIAKTTISSP